MQRQVWTEIVESLGLRVLAAMPRCPMIQADSRIVPFTLALRVSRHNTRTLSRVCYLKDKCAPRQEAPFQRP